LKEGNVPSERVQRQIDSLLDQAEAALGRLDWDGLRGDDTCHRRDVRALLAELDKS
jgi:hypothetical protein